MPEHSNPQASGDRWTHPHLRALGPMACGWREYAESVVPSSVSHETMLLIGLGYYAGAAHALGQVMSCDDDGLRDTAEDLADELLDETDRLLAEVLDAAAR